MKKAVIFMLFLLIIFILFITIPMLAGCSKTKSNQLDVHVWEGYLPEEVVALFEKETGIKLNINLVTENGAMLTLLKGGGKADIIMPTQNTTNRYYEAGLTRPLDLEKITNYEKISKYLREQPWAKWDGRQMGRGEVYAIPYIFGTTGLVINTSRYTKSMDDIGWEILFNTDLKGRVSSLDGLESIMMILDLKNIPRENVITDTNYTLDNIRGDVLALKNNVLKFYKSGAEISDLMKNEEIWAGQIWDGGGRALSQSDNKFKYILPKQGGMGWTDTFMIPKDSENSTEANLFINFMLRPDIAAIITDRSGFVTTVEGALDMTQEIDKNLYRFTDEEIEKLKWNPNLSQEVRSICISFWEEMLTVH